MTIRSVRACYRDGVLQLLEDVNLSEDQEVLLTIEEQPESPPDGEGFRRVAGAWADMFEDPEQYIQDLYQARIDGTRPPRHW